MASNQKRKDVILNAAYKNGTVSVSYLSQELSVSTATIRRDLHTLAAEGLLELTHGGASLVRNWDYSFMSKSMRNVEAKQIIAQLAAGIVKDGDQIFLDSGTTCFAMAGYLRGKKGLSVIVNSVRTAQELHAPGLNIITLGGQYRYDRMDTVGPMAAASLEQLRGYLAFIGIDGISMDFGMTAIDIESANIFGLAIRNARRCILLADSSKFDAPGLYKIADWQAVSAVITDIRPPQAWVDFFARQSIEMIYPQDAACPTKTHINLLGIV